MVIRVEPVEAIDVAVLPGRLAYETANRAAIDAAFAAASAANPALYNGGAYLFETAEVAGRRFVARGRATDYATFLHWRAAGFEPDTMAHCFPVGLVVSADGLVMLGRMAAHTVNAGRAYAPSGSFDPHDLTPEGRLDALANALREIGEETGIDATAFPRDDGHLVVSDGPRRSIVTILHAPRPAAALAAEALAFLAAEAEPELSEVFFVRPGDRLPEDGTVGYVNPLLAHLESTLRR